MRPRTAASMVTLSLLLALLPAHGAAAGAVPGASGGAAADAASVDGVWTRPPTATTPPPGSVPAYDAATRQLLAVGDVTPSTPGRVSTWSWDGREWTELHPATSPVHRSSPAVAYDPATAQLVLFGGDTDGSADVDDAFWLDDTWTWDGSDWHEVHPAHRPPPRGEAALAYHAPTGTLVLFGGAQYEGFIGDTWTWDGSDWHEEHPATSPAPRSGAAFAAEPGSGRLVLFGGYHYDDPGGIGNDPWDHDEPIGDTWIWDGGNWTQQQVEGPEPRVSAAAAGDPDTGQILLFGGWGPATAPRTTWLWNGTGWRPAAGADQPSAMNGASMAFDSATDQMVLLGTVGSGPLTTETWIHRGDPTPGPVGDLTVATPPARPP